MAAVVQTGTYAGAASPVTGAWPAPPTVGNVLVAVVNSATTVTTPAGWTLRASLVNSQGFYVYERTATGTGDTPSFTTNGNWPTSVSLIELNAAQVGAFDLAVTGTETAGSLTSKATPAIGTTGASGDVVFAVVALHGLFSASTFGSPTWDNTFTPLLSSTLQSPQAGSSDAVQHFIGTRSTAAAGTVTATTATWPNTAENAMGLQFGYKLAATGTTTAKTQGDPVGLTDTVSAQLTVGGNGYTSTPADPVGVTDAATATLARQLSVNVSDGVGVFDTDTQQAVDYGEGPGDTVGLSDAVTASLDRVVTVADLLGLIDTATAAAATPTGQSLADPVTTTDTANVQLGTARAPSDAVGLRDSAVATLDRAAQLVATISDTIGATDATYTAGNARNVNITVLAPVGHVLTLQSPTGHPLTIRPPEAT